MHFKSVATWIGGSLLSLAPVSAAHPGDFNIPAAIQSENIRVAAPEMARFTPANGYTGDKTLLTTAPPLAREDTGKFDSGAEPVEGTSAA